jgi:hypothetical protein
MRSEDRKGNLVVRDMAIVKRDFRPEHQVSTASRLLKKIDVLLKLIPLDRIRVVAWDLPKLVVQKVKSIGRCFQGLTPIHRLEAPHPAALTPADG